MYNLQLRSYLRLLHLPDNRLAAVALKEHFCSSWNSPYIRYLYTIRAEVDLLSLPDTEDMITVHLDNWFLRKYNAWQASGHHPALENIRSFTKQSYVCESLDSAWISRFCLGAAGLGNKVPIDKTGIRDSCPVCPVPTINTEEHVLLFCPRVSRLRKTLRVTEFLLCCRVNGSQNEAFKLFVNGFSPSGVLVPITEYRLRGRDMRKLVEAWLGSWVKK